VTLPAGVTEIGNKAFEYCVKLTSVKTSGEGLLTIGTQAFHNCSALASVTLPASVTSVGNEAFAAITAGLTYKTDAVSVTYGKNVFKGTTVKKAVCKQSSTTYELLKDTAKKLEYSGAYFDKLTASVNVGDELVLELNNAEGTISWKSSNKKVATVDNGVVSGLQAGTAKISATCGDETLTVSVTVNKLKISATKLTITAQYTGKLSVPNATGIRWSSSDKKIATVDQKGTVTGKKAGTATITAKVGNSSYKCKVTVKANQKTFSSFSTNAYRYSRLTFKPASVAKTAKGYKVKGYFINGTSDRIKVSSLRVVVSLNGKTIASKKISNPGLNMGARKSKSKTITFTGSEVKKNVNLLADGSTVNVYATWNETRTVTKTIEVPAQ
jgi:uncharacterized protein YjdB